VGKKVLVVDDSKFWRLVLQSILEKFEIEALFTAENAMQGIEIALKNFPDIIITDYNMPGISGLQMCLYLRSIPAFKDAGIVVLTGSDDIINQFWAEHSGANKFLSKLLPKDDLEKELESFIKMNFCANNSTEKFYISNIYDVLEQKMRSEVLNREILSLIQFARDELYVVRKLVNLFENFAQFSASAVLLLSPIEGRIYNFGFQATRKTLHDELVKNFEKPIQPSDWSYIGGYGQELKIEDLITFPIKYDDNEIGLIAFSKTADFRVLIKTLNEAYESLSLLFNTLNLFRELRVASTIDGLTGLFNKKELLRFLEETHELSKKSDFTYYVAMFDVDNFKKVNDTYGHLVGDEVLKTIGKILKEKVQGNGIVGRYGGEEFCAILPKLDADSVVRLIDDILDTVRNTKFSHGSCTISCGAVSSEYYSSPTEVLKAADEMLYISKRTGKDKASFMFLPKENSPTF